MINEAGGVFRITATGQVKGANGKMLGFFVASGTPTVKLWDNESAGSGTILLNTMQTVAATLLTVFTLLLLVLVILASS